MSRDAKVGLVIVFAFVFLFGTILVHRLQSKVTAPGETGGDLATNGTEPTASPSGSSSGDSSQIASGSTSPTTAVVDAVPTETFSSPFKNNSGDPAIGSTFPNPPRTGMSSSPLREPTESSEQSASGGRIVLTNPQSRRPPAVEVEPPMASRGMESNAPGTPRESAEDTADGGDEPPRRSNPLLDIAKRPPDPPNSPAEVKPVSPSEHDLDTPEDSAELVQSNRRSVQSSGASRSIPELEPAPSLSPTEESEESDPRRPPIQQAAGNKRPEPADSTPPKPPGFRDPQPKIESVPERVPRSGFRQPDESVTQPWPKERQALPKSKPSTEDHLTGQKTYTVKEGDSFWSISAKLYGTGKPYRALEEYNRDRIPNYEDGQRILRPGLVIVVPDVSVLQSQSPAPKKDTASPTGRTKPDPLSASKPGGQATSKADPSFASGIYRVQEGDTLSTISLQQLGTSKRWEEILRLNQDKLTSPQQIRPGMILKMPTSRPGEKIADQPRTGR